MPEPPMTYSAEQTQHWSVPRGLHRDDGPAEVYMPEEHWGLPRERQWMQIRWYRLNRLERCFEPRVHHPNRLPMNL